VLRNPAIALPGASDKSFVRPSAATALSVVEGEASRPGLFAEFTLSEAEGLRVTRNLTDALQKVFLKTVDPQ
jgi:hypothetical protein